MSSYGPLNSPVLSTNFNPPKYKGAEGVVDRIRIICPDITDIFIATKSHYIPALGYIICKSEYGANCCSVWGKSRWRIGSVIYNYSLTNPLMVWIFGEAVYRTLSTIHEDFPINKCDLKIECTIPEFQRLEITPTKNKQELNVNIPDFLKYKNWIKNNISQDLPVSSINTLNQHTAVQNQVSRGVVKPVNEVRHPEIREAIIKPMEASFVDGKRRIYWD